MNTFTKTLATLGLSLFATTALAHSSEFEATDNRVTTRLCIAAAEGKKMQLRQELKESRLKKQYVIEHVKCNGLEFTDFVERYGAQPELTLSYMTGKRSIPQLAAQ